VDFDGKNPSGRESAELVAGRLFRAAFIVFLLLSCLEGAFPQGSPIPLVVDPNPVGKGDRFTLTAVIPVTDTAGVFVQEPELPASLKLQRGPFIRPVSGQSLAEIPELDISRGEKVEISYSGLAQSTGKFIIPSFSISAGNQSFRTVETILSVGVMKNKTLVLPLEARWQIKSPRIYQGSAVPLVLEVRNQEKILLFGRLRVEQPKDGLFDEVFGLGRVETTQVGSMSLYHFPAASFMFTPSRPGNFTLPKAVVETGITPLESGQSGSLSGEAPALNFTVLPLPPEVEESGAVGSFTLSSSISGAEASAGADVEILIRVEGEGNLSFLRIPSPLVQDGRFLFKREDHEFQAGDSGYKGYREVSYHYTFDNPGKALITVPPFHYVDPVTSFVHTLPGRNFSLSVRQVRPGEAEIEERPFPFTPVRAGTGRGFSLGGYYRNPENYLILIPGPLVLFVVYFTRKRKFLLASVVLFLAMAQPDVGYSEKFSSGLAAYDRGALDEAERIFGEILAEEEADPALYYNLALIKFRNGDLGHAVAGARKALYLSPFHGEDRRLLSYLEEEGNLTYQVAPALSLHPDIFFLGLVVSVNAAGFVGVLVLHRRKGWFFILFVLLGAAVLVSLSGLVITSGAPQKRSGVVVAADSQFKRIPLARASDWAPLKPGTSVRVLGEAEGFYLAETGFGMKGWIEKDRVVLDGINLKRIKKTR